jgi:hypothetical protein
MYHGKVIYTREHTDSILFVYNGAGKGHLIYTGKELNVIQLKYKHRLNNTSKIYMTA